MLHSENYLSRGEIDHLLSLLKRRTRDEIMLETYIRTGCRPRELLALSPDSLYTATGEVFVLGLKGSNPRAIPLPRGLMDALRALSAGNTASGYGSGTPRQLDKLLLFPISYSRFYQIWQLYRPTPKPPRAARHAMGTHLYAKTRDIRLVQYTLGHKSVVNTEIYSAHVDGQARMKKGHKGLY